MKHYNKSKRHYNNKRSKGKQKTKKNKKKGGGWLDYFTTTSVGIPGFGSVGKCQSKQILENGVWKEQKCYITPFGPVYKTVQSDGAANGAATTNTKAWYQFW